MTSPEGLAAVEALAEEDLEAAGSRLREVLEELDSLSPEDLDRATALCERIGLVTLAVRVVRRRLEQAPREAGSWRRLATLHEELGDLDRAARCRRRADTLDPPSAPSADPLDDGPRATADPPPLVDLSFDRADLSRFLDLWSGREDHHARQWFDARRDRGGYAPVATPLGHAALRRHLDGQQTLGVYLLRAGDTVRFCIFDVDATREALREAAGDAGRVAELGAALERAGQDLLARLEGLGLPALYEDSGHKGRHAWLFFEEPQPAGEVLALGRAILRTMPPGDQRVAVEFFPKQGRVSGKGLGNLVKLPLGIHRVSGRRSWLLRRDGTVERRPFKCLREVRRVSSTTLEQAGREVAAASTAEPVGPPTPETPETPKTPAPPPPKPWTAAAFRSDPQFRAVLDGCALLRRLVRRAVAEDPLEHAEILALRHTLGHLDRGPAGFNFLAQRIPGLPAAVSLGSALRGCPTSCATLQRRLPGLARQTGCGCEFGPRLPTYANPLLHLATPERTVHLRLLEGEGEGTPAEPPESVEPEPPAEPGALVESEEPGPPEEPDPPEEP